jgi:anti-anti-sigma regulatory factor
MATEDGSLVASLSITFTILSAGIVVLLMRGSMRRGDVHAFRGALDRVLRAHHPREVRLDFSGLVEIEASAAAVVTTAARDAARIGTTVTVVNASDPVRQQMRLAGGEDVLSRAH